MLLVVINSERLLSAFLGALAALIIKHIYDATKEYSRLNRIRRIIKVDLENQSTYFNYLIEEFEIFIKYVNGEIEVYDSMKSSMLNIDLFKAHSAIDYYKAFEEHHYKMIMDIYYLIGFYYDIIPNEEIKRYLREIKELDLKKKDLIDEYVKVKFNYKSSEFKLLLSGEIEKMYNEDLNNINKDFTEQYIYYIKNYKLMVNDINKLLQIYKLHYETILD